MGFREQLISTLSSADSGIDNPRFDLEDMTDGKVGGFIVSPTFEAMPQIERQHLVWDCLDKIFEPEILRNVVTIVTVTPAEAETD